MREDQIKELEELSETMTADMIQIAYAAVECKFDTDKERGNKVWLYKGLNQCASAITKLEQVLAYRRGVLPPTSVNPDTQTRHEQNLIDGAKKAIEQIKASQKAC